MHSHSQSETSLNNYTNMKMDAPNNELNNTELLKNKVTYKSSRKKEDIQTYLGLYFNLIINYSEQIPPAKIYKMISILHKHIKELSFSFKDCYLLYKKIQNFKFNTKEYKTILFDFYTRISEILLKRNDINKVEKFKIKFMEFFSKDSNDKEIEKEIAKYQQIIPEISYKKISNYKDIIDKIKLYLNKSMGILEKFEIFFKQDKIENGNLIRVFNQNDNPFSENASYNISIISKNWINSFIKWLDYYYNYVKDKNDEQISKLTEEEVMGTCFPGHIINFDILSYKLNNIDEGLNENKCYINIKNLDNIYFVNSELWAFLEPTFTCDCKCTFSITNEDIKNYKMNNTNIDEKLREYIKDAHNPKIKKFLFISNENVVKYHYLNIPLFPNTELSSFKMDIRLVWLSKMIKFGSTENINKKKLRFFAILNDNHCISNDNNNKDKNQTNQNDNEKLSETNSKDEIPEDIKKEDSNEIKNNTHSNNDDKSGFCLNDCILNILLASKLNFESIQIPCRELESFEELYNLPDNQVIICTITSAFIKKVFFNPISKKDINIKCDNCSKSTPKKQIIKCNVCNYGYFCSNNCLEKSLNHVKMHFILESIFGNSEKNSYETFELLNKYSYSSIDGKTYKGIKNIGNTCYFNASFQALVHSLTFTNYLDDSVFKSNIYKKEEKFLLIEKFANLIIRYFSGTENTFVEEIKFFFKEVLSQSNHVSRFIKGKMQDSQEFIIELLNALQEEVDKITNSYNNNGSVANTGEINNDKENKKDMNRMIDLFTGNIKSEVTCSNCLSTSTTYQSFLFLQLDIPPDPNILTNLNSNQTPNPNQITQSPILNKENKKIFTTNIKYFPYLVNSKDNQLKCEILSVCFEKNDSVLTVLIRVCDILNKKFNQDIIPFLLSKSKVIRNNLKLDNNFYKYINNGLEIILYETLDSSSKKVIIYPCQITETSIDYLTYPFIIDVQEDMCYIKFEELVYQKLASFFEKDEDVNEEKDNVTKNLNYSNYENLFTLHLLHQSKNTCQICLSESKSYCPLNKVGVDNLVIDTINKVNPNKEFSNIFLLEIINYNQSKKIYQNLPMKLLEDKNKSIIKEKEDFEVTLYDCIKHTFGDIVFEGNNKYYCDKCKSYQEAKKTHTLNILPNYLLIYFNRFLDGKEPTSNYLTSIFKGKNKNEKYVEYPEIIEDFYNCKYELYAVILHKLNFGWHYTCLCKENGDIWYEYDDDKKIICSNSYVINSDAYVLFYRKININNK